MTGIVGRVIDHRPPPPPPAPATTDVLATVMGLTPGELRALADRLAAHNERTGRAYTVAVTAPVPLAGAIRAERAAAGRHPHLGVMRVAS